MNYLGDDKAAAALDVVHFVREIVEEYPQLREDILAKLLENFGEINTGEVYRVALWIIGEYSTLPPSPFVFDLVPTPFFFRHGRCAGRFVH